MPRRMRSLTPAPTQKRTITASSATIERKKTNAVIYKNSEEWQKECYRHYRICGEARFAAQFFGHALSKAVVYAASVPGDVHSEPLEDGPTKDRLDELFVNGQSSILSPLGIHLTVAGECYLIGRTPQPSLTEAQKVGLEERPPPAEKIWEIRSVLEVKSNGTGGEWWIDQTGMMPPRIDLTDDDTVIRIWTPDPARAGEADSPFRSLLPILEEIEWLTRYTFAQCSSRLAGAGLAIFPEEIDFPPPPDAPDGEERSKTDNLMAYLADLMLAPIDDPGDPRAKVPGVMTAPGEWIDSIKWLTFWSELDSEAKTMRQENIQRFALGMDLPPERVLGMAMGATAGGGGSKGVNHWGAWQVDEDTIKMHVEPMLDVVVWALINDYTDGGQVGYDTSKLRLRPDRSAEALELWDRGLLKGTVAVKENGFSEEDMPDPEEQKMWLLVKLASGSATPEMVVSALQLLGVPMPQPMLEQDPNESRPTPSLEDHPSRDLPDPEESEAAALVAASDALVFRALERAGNRIRQVIRDAGGTVPTAASYEVHTLAPAPPKSAAKLLNDAWACAPQVLAGCGADPDKVVPLLDGYTASLLTSGQPHTREALVKWLAAS